MGSPDTPTLEAQEEDHKFKIRVGYRVSTRPAWDRFVNSFLIIKSKRKTRELVRW